MLFHPSSYSNPKTDGKVIDHNLPLYFRLDSNGFYFSIILIHFGGAILGNRLWTPLSDSVNVNEV